MSDYNLDSHYSDNMKVKRTAVKVADAPSNFIKKTKLFSENESENKIHQINTDIYNSAKKERDKNGFNSSLFFKIFCLVGVATVCYSYPDKVKRFLKKLFPKL